MEETYRKIFTRLGLKFRVVEADSGAIGGSGSKEFMVLADSGEDTIVVCDACDYGANVEAAIRKEKECEAQAPEAVFAKFHTPDIKTIEQLSNFFHVDPYYLVKTVAKKALYDEGKSKVILFALRGADELQEVKACNAVNANDLVDVTEEELTSLGLVAGYMGPTVVPEGVEVVYDNRLKDASSMICGANEEGYHLIGNSFIGIDEEHHDLVAVQDGDLCSCCGSVMRYTKGIEAGHIFQLGTQYSEPLAANFLDENGKAQAMVMGTYGIGVSRLLAAIIEQNHDEKGCIWTKESAPFDLQIIISNIKDENQVALGEKLYDLMLKKGVDVLLDERKDRFGAKMKDYELLGVPHAVVIGKKLADGLVEFITRDGMQKDEILVDNIENILLERF
jgi:prolyl-tRNA synthetase